MARGPPPPMGAPPVAAAPPQQPIVPVTGSQGGHMWVPNAMEPPRCAPPVLHPVRRTPIRDNIELIESRFFTRYASPMLLHARENGLYDERLLDKH